MKHKILKHKNGNVDDLIEYLIIFLVLVITLFLTWTTLDHYDSQIQNTTSINQSSAATDFMTKFKARFVTGWDYGFLLLLIILPAVSFFWSKNVQIDNVALSAFIYFILFIFFIIAAMVVSNIFGKFMDISTFQNFAAQYKIIAFIMPKLPYYTMLYGLLIGYGLFTKE